MNDEHTQTKKEKMGFRNHILVFICSLILVICFLIPAHGAQLHSLNDLNAIQTEISRQGLTRIKVQEDRIRNVFGVSGEYVLETDEDQGQLFIRPMGLGAVNSISLTLTTENGRTQDLLLTPTDKAPEALILQVDPSSPTELKSSRILPSRAEIESLLHACREQRIPVGYKLMPLDLKTLNHKHHLIREIRNDHLRGLTYEVRNNSQEVLPLRQEEFASNNQIIAVWLPKPTLNPGEKTYVYVVAKL